MRLVCLVPTIRLPARITRTLIALMLGMLSERMRFG